MKIIDSLPRVDAMLDVMVVVYDKNHKKDKKMLRDASSEA